MTVVMMVMMMMMILRTMLTIETRRLTTHMFLWHN